MGRPSIPFVLILDPSSLHAVYHAPGENGQKHTHCGVKVPRQFKRRDPGGTLVSFPSVVRLDHAERFGEPCRKCYEEVGSAV